MPKKIENMSLAELETLRKQVDDALSQIKHKEIKVLREKTVSEAQRLGITLSELLGGSPAKPVKSKGKVAAKYRHPENHSLTWSGRGLPPKWMQELIDNGRGKEEFLIERSA